MMCSLAEIAYGEQILSANPPCKNRPWRKTLSQLPNLFWMVMAQSWQHQCKLETSLPFSIHSTEATVTRITHFCHAQCRYRVACNFVFWLCYCCFSGCVEQFIWCWNFMFGLTSPHLLPAHSPEHYSPLTPPPFLPDSKHWYAFQHQHLPHP